MVITLALIWVKARAWSCGSTIPIIITQYILLYCQEIYNQLQQIIHQQTSDQPKKKLQDKENTQVEIEKGLVILLLCFAGALIAESMPTEEQQRVLELLQQELASAKASQYPVAEKQRVGFPTNPACGTANP